MMVYYEKEITSELLFLRDMINPESQGRGK
jgi:hypothetical protein